MSESKSKYGHRPYNWFEGIVNKLGGEAQAERFLRGELVVTEPVRWREQDGVIYFSVRSDGTTGPQWIERIMKQDFRMDGNIESVLRSSDFKPTIGVTYEIAVLKGMLFQNSDRITRKIRDEASRRQLTKPNAEVACIVRERFADQELEAMGLIWIVTMHEPISDSDGGPRLLAAHRDDGGRWLDAIYDSPDYGWGLGGGFAFVVSPACSA